MAQQPQLHFPILIFTSIFVISFSSFIRPPHPFDPLTESEFKLIRNVIKKKYPVGPAHRFTFQYVGLNEPDKSGVLSWHLSLHHNVTPPPRQAFVIARENRKTREIVVDFSSRAIVSDIIRVGHGNPMLTIDEQEVATELVLKFKPFRQSIRRRGLKVSEVVVTSSTMGWFGEKQVREIAVALERSCHRFLWSLRRPSHLGHMNCSPPEEFKNLEEILPEGFLDRTAKIGKIIGWAPQTAVLGSHAIGGFVTHCGWNSILESVWFGVPTAAWPIFAEQQFNAFQMVEEELGLAVNIRKECRRW